MSMSSGFSYQRQIAVTPSDLAAVNNILGAWFVQVTVAGNITVRCKDKTSTPAIPLIPNQLYPVGSDWESILAAGTTATGIHGLF